MENTNLMLKKIIGGLSKYDKETFITMLGVDIENCNPLLDIQYKSSTMSDNLFIFLNDKFRILGILQGSTFIKKFDRFTTYVNFPKNRKNLQINSTYVLCITPIMRKYRRKTVVREVSPKQELAKRLEEYRSKKYTNISNDDIEIMIQKITNKLLINDLNENIEIIEKNKLIWWSSKDNKYEILSAFMKYCSEYKKYLNLFNKYNEDRKDYVKLCGNYYEKDYLSSKNDIIKWSNSFNISGN